MFKKKFDLIRKELAYQKKNKERIGRFIGDRFKLFNRGWAHSKGKLLRLKV